MTGKWSAGPWRQSGLAVADIGGARVIVPAIGVRRDMAEANARLIAAAPEMAELLLAWTENRDAVKAAGPHIVAATRALLARINGAK